MNYPNNLIKNMKCSSQEYATTIMVTLRTHKNLEI